MLSVPLQESLKNDVALRNCLTGKSCILRYEIRDLLSKNSKYYWFVFDVWFVFPVVKKCSNDTIQSLISPRLILYNIMIHSSFLIIRQDLFLSYSSTTRKQSWIPFARQKCNASLFAPLLNIFNCFCTYRTKLSIKCHSITGRAAELYAAIRNPVVFLSNSVNFEDSRLNIGGSKAFGVDQNLSFIWSWVHIRNRCPNCMSNRSRNLPAMASQLGWIVDFQLSTSRCLDSKRWCCLCNVFNNWTSSSAVVISLWGRVNCNCPNSFHKCPTQNNTERFSISNQHLFYETKRSNSNVLFTALRYQRSVSKPSSTNILGLQDKALSYHDVFYDTQTRSLSQNSRGRLVCHMCFTTELQRCGFTSTKRLCNKQSQDNMQLKTNEQNRHDTLKHTEISSGRKAKNKKEGGRGNKKKKRRTKKGGRKQQKTRGEGNTKKRRREQHKKGGEKQKTKKEKH